MGCILSRIFPQAKVSTYGKISVSKTSQVNNPEIPGFSSQANFFADEYCFYLLINAFYQHRTDFSNFELEKLANSL